MPLLQPLERRARSNEAILSPNEENRGHIVAENDHQSARACQGAERQKKKVASIARALDCKQRLQTAAAPRGDDCESNKGRQLRLAIAMHDEPRAYSRFAFLQLAKIEFMHDKNKQKIEIQ